MTDTAPITSLLWHEGSGLHDKQHSTPLAFCPAASDTQEALQASTPPAPSPALKPYLRAGLCRSSPLPSEGTWIPTGGFLLPIHPGDRVVAVCILVIAVLDGVGGAGAVCRGSKGQLGLLDLFCPQGCSEQRAKAEQSTPSRGISASVPQQLRPLPATPFPVKPEQRSPCNKSAAGWEGSGTGAVPVGAATFPSLG